MIYMCFLHERKDLRFLRIDLGVFRFGHLVLRGGSAWGRGGGGHFKPNYVTKIRYVTCIEMPQCAAKYLTLNALQAGEAIFEIILSVGITSSIYPINSLNHQTLLSTE